MTVVRRGCACDAAGMSDLDDVLAFWFSPEPTTNAEMDARSRMWFRGGPDVDASIRERFGRLVEDARAGRLDAWAETTRGALGLVILIDQFSRNLYRGDAASFSCDDKALALAREGYDTGRFATLGVLERTFAAMPFRHAEDLEAQKRGVALAVTDALAAEPHQKDFLVMAVDFARKHLDVIARFGRFPHRNETLGRASTPEEREYLAYLKFAGQWL